MNSSTSKLAGWLILALMLCQFIPLGRINPPSHEPETLSTPVRTLLGTKCGQCHSNGTRWPESAFVAPLSWYVVHEVQKARQAVNFSEWQGVSGNRKLQVKTRIHALIVSGNTSRHASIPGFAPPLLSVGERELLLGWSSEPEREPRTDSSAASSSNASL